MFCIHLYVIYNGKIGRGVNSSFLSHLAVQLKKVPKSSLGR